MATDTDHDDIVDAELEDDTPRQLAHQHPATVGLFAGATSPAEQLAEAQETASVLATFVTAQGLARKLSNRADARPYVQVEGWQFLGTMLGLTATVDWSRKTSDHRAPTYKTEQRQGRNGSYTATVLDQPGKGGWEARATVKRIGDGQILGVGEAECLWDERNWSDRDSYALRSMAQTRAISKAYRGPLAFVMVLAGFAATPAEEMDGVQDRLEAEDNGLKCPSCGSGVFDNRDDNVKRRENNEKQWPAFKCRNQSCTGGTDRDGKPGPWFSWSESALDTEDYINGAKADVLAAVREATAPLVLADMSDTGDLETALDMTGGDPDARARIEAMLEDPDTIEQAVAYLVWTFLLGSDQDLRSGDIVTKAERAKIRRAAYEYVGAPDPDQDDRWDGYGYG